MAAATVAAGPYQTVFGNKRVEYARLTTPANASTYTAATLSTIEAVFVSLRDASAVASTSYAVTTSGNVATFVLDGTARTIDVIVIGV